MARLVGSGAESRWLRDTRTPEWLARSRDMSQSALHVHLRTFRGASLVSHGKRLRRLQNNSQHQATVDADHETFDSTNMRNSRPPERSA
jgi:hypothetical protein